jgi:hypothetical protein
MGALLFHEQRALGTVPTRDAEEHPDLLARGDDVGQLMADLFR